MTETIGPVPARIDQQQLAQELVDAARTEGVELVSPSGPLTGLTEIDVALDDLTPRYAGALKRLGEA